MLNKVFGYYPGCSQHGSAAPYAKSVKKVCDRLGIVLQELPGWKCCGATSGHSIAPELTAALNIYNLNKAEELGVTQIMTSCAACFSNLTTCSTKLVDNESCRKMKIQYKLQVAHKTVYHILQLLAELEIREEIQAKIIKKFRGLKAACYYGCLIVRPHEKVHFDDAENPQSMDVLLNQLGMTTVDWSHKTECCGASFSVCAPQVAKAKVQEILNQARNSGADIVVVACPLCQSNLEMYQATARSPKTLPIVYVTQMLGLALGLTEAEVGLNQMLGRRYLWRDKLTL